MTVFSFNRSVTLAGLSFWVLAEMIILVNSNLSSHKALSEDRLKSLHQYSPIALGENVMSNIEAKNSPTKIGLSRSSRKRYELVWADEFNRSGKPDPAKWGFEHGFIRNRESQYYTDQTQNVRVKKGFLIIEAHKERVKNKDFTSLSDKDWRKNKEFTDYTAASLTTKDKGEWTYGKIEVRAKLPRGRGMWPAIWMLGANWKQVSWPRCGEIDIMENVGFDPLMIHGTVHTMAYNHNKGTQKGKNIEVENPAEVFHIYSIEWTPEKIDFMVDGKIYNTFVNEHKTQDEWPFDQNFHLKLNIAVGGDWGGQKGIDASVFPQRMLIDYVRVYQLK